MKELDKKFDHKAVEKGRYQNWVANKVFQSIEDAELENYSIILPPPNVTGKLHLGHAWDGALQDMLIRYKKMKGYNAVWFPAMDHAGIATQAKVEEKLRNQGINKDDLGREKFVEQVWNWKDEYAETIREQWGKLGLALDYSKEKFTLDEDASLGVRKIFVDLYNKGLIYQGYRITNWDPQAQTALSDIEVIHREVVGNEHYFKYLSVDNPDEYLEVMTTRPETMFGDGALAVHPDDERYSNLVGKKYIVPNTQIHIPVIQDEYVKMDKGSGVVKITMAHDPNDFEVAKRHNLEPRIIMNLDGKMATNEFVPLEFQGLERFEARKKQVQLAKQNNLLIKVEEIVHSVGHSERSGAVVEPLLTKQWYVKMKGLADNLLAKQKTDEKVNFYPQRFENTLNTWMENIQDWCISRQLWWGHQIPAWTNANGELYVGLEAPSEEGWTQDEDVLDTWFSSGIWPLTMTEWLAEDQTKYQKYFPTSTLVTGYDIIFFWVSRMMVQSLEFTEQFPFKDVLIHGLIRDAEGRKMSKSLGNGIDPMDVIDEYGADTLRFFLTTNSSPGQDLKYNEEKLKSTWNFINKIWNISRYVLMATEDIDLQKENILDYSKTFNDADIFILSKLNETIGNVDYNMDKYEFGEAAKSLYSFIWEDFANWYLEVSKVVITTGDEEATRRTKVILKSVLESIIKMIHPYMPFVSEEIYSTFEFGNYLINSKFPEKIEIEQSFSFERVIAVISAIRNIKSENEIKPSKEVNIIIQNNNKFTAVDELIIKKIAKVDELNYQTDKPSKEVFTKVLTVDTLHVISAGLIDVEAKIKELKITADKLENEIKRSINMLSNESFTDKAPQSKIDVEIEKAQTYMAQYSEVQVLLLTYDEIIESTIIKELETVINKLRG